MGLVAWVGVGVDVGVPVEVPVAVPVKLGVALGVKEAVAVMVQFGVWVTVNEAVPVRVLVGEGGNVAVEVGLDVWVRVNVRVEVADRVGVEEPETAVKVLVGFVPPPGVVGLLCFLQPTTKTLPANRMDKAVFRIWFPHRFMPSLRPKLTRRFTTRTCELLNASWLAFFQGWKWVTTPLQASNSWIPLSRYRG